MKIAGAILAAGTSSRMGCNKLLLPYGEHTVIGEILCQMQKSDLDDILVITGFEREYVERLIQKDHNDRIRIIFNENFELGRAESIKCAVRSIGDQTDALLFMVGDKPTIRTELINRAISEFKRKLPDILYVKTPAGRGHPIIFSRRLFAALLKLEGDTVGDEIITEYTDGVVELSDTETQADVDTIDDYRMLIDRMKYYNNPADSCGYI
jgi:molybdenum cofactor cytidylyltransferase